MTPTPDTASTADDRSGQTLADRYLLESLIGRGGMSSVYRAQDQSLGRTVTIKLFLPALASADDLRRQQDEIRMLASLNHPSLVTLFDAVADDDGRAFLVLEYVDGDDLREKLVNNTVGVDSAVAIGIDVASALAYVHERGVVHRDVKPGNILVTASSTVPGALSAKLADFGIARLIDAARITMTGSVLGTASYLSPEQALGHSVTAASDIYSLGLVILECVTGEKAFPGNGVEAAVARLSRDPHIPDALDPRLADLLRSMTNRSPDSRPTANDVTIELRDLAVEGIVTPPSDSAEDAEPTAAMMAPDATVTTMGLDATTVMPAPDATAVMSTTDATAVMPVTESTPRAEPTRNSVARASRARPWLIAAGTAASIVVVAIVVSSNATPSPNPTPTPTAAPIEYPAVEGTLGEHLTILQKSVTP